MLQLTLILGSLHYRRKKSLKNTGTQKLPEYSNRALWAQTLTQENQGKKFFNQKLIIALVEKLPPWTVFILNKNLMASNLEVEVVETETHLSRKGLHRPWLHLLQRWIAFRFSFLAFASFCTYRSPYNYCTFSSYRIIYLWSGRGGWACTRARIFPAFTL